MPRLTLVRRAIGSRSVYLKIILAQFGRSGVKVNHSSQCVAAKQNTVRTHQNIRPLQDIRIHRYRILQMAAAIDGIVHADAVDDQ